MNILYKCSFYFESNSKQCVFEKKKMRPSETFNCDFNMYLYIFQIAFTGMENGRRLLRSLFSAKNDFSNMLNLESNTLFITSVYDVSEF